MRSTKRTPEQIRADMTEFCRREMRSGDMNAYIAALTSAAHLCDQISREAKRKSERTAAKACGDFIWQVADAMKAERDRAREVAPSTL
jgi:hypothetical protein